jgi:hypothetical protein
MLAGLGKEKARLSQTVTKLRCPAVQNTLPPPGLPYLFILNSLRPICCVSAHSKGLGCCLASLLSEAAEEGDVVAEHGVVSAGVLHGGIEFAFDAGDGLEKELAEVAEGVGSLVRDALFG